MLLTKPAIVIWEGLLPSAPMTVSPVLAAMRILSPAKLSPFGQNHSSLSPEFSLTRVFSAPVLSIVRRYQFSTYWK